jgi:DNA-binding transcriptional regulator YiaG
MVETKSTENFEQYLAELKQEYYAKVCNKPKVDEWIDYINNKYKQYNRVFLPHTLMWNLYAHKKRMVKDNQHLWFLFVGRKGGEGKSTLAKHCLHFIDESFAEDLRVVNDYDQLIEMIYQTKRIKKLATPGILMDEVDPTIHMLSKEGTQLRQILTKIRQLNLVVGMCVNDLSDLPHFVYKLFSGMFLLENNNNNHRFYYWNQNEDYCGNSIMADIRKDYTKMKHTAFDLKKSKAIVGNETFSRLTPFFDEETYLNQKENDIFDNIQTFRATGKGRNPKAKKYQTYTLQEVVKMLRDQTHFSYEEIGKAFNTSPRTLMQWVNGK